MARATSRRDISEALQKEEDQLKAEAACNAPTGNATQLLRERREAHLKLMECSQEVYANREYQYFGRHINTAIKPLRDE